MVAGRLERVLHPVAQRCERVRVMSAVHQDHCMQGNQRVRERRQRERSHGKQQQRQGNQHRQYFEDPGKPVVRLDARPDEDDQHDAEQVHRQPGSLAGRVSSPDYRSGLAKNAATVCASRSGWSWCSMCPHLQSCRREVAGRNVAWLRARLHPAVAAGIRSPLRSRTAPVRAPRQQASASSRRYRIGLTRLCAGSKRNGRVHRAGSRPGLCDKGCALRGKTRITSLQHGGERIDAGEHRGSIASVSRSCRSQSR